MSDGDRVLVLDDEAIVCERLSAHLTGLGFQVETFTESQAAMDRLAQGPVEVVVTDLKMKGPTGLDVLHFVRKEAPSTQVILITGYASIEASREAEFGGVYEFVTKPFQMSHLGKLVKRAAARARRQQGASGA